MGKERMKKIRFLWGYQKERKWLEDMALQGWFLENINFGIFYTFVKGEPKHLLYDLDRFNLPKKPTLEEIRHKEMFLEMARELGWREVTHDETMTYYFAKEYEEDGINELYNDEESRRHRAAKFRDYLSGNGKRLIFWGMVILVIDLVLRIQMHYLGDDYLAWYDWFALVYVCINSVLALSYWKLGEWAGREMRQTRQEWEESRDRHRMVRKLILTARGLSRFLAREEEQGWILTEVTPMKYYFEKGHGTKQVYTMDSKRMTNRRQKKMHRQEFKDGKDWNGLNNDWQVQSVHDAEEKGWTFVCALENRAVIYRGEAGVVKPLNDARYDNSLRCISLIGEYGLYLLCGGLVGAVIGFLCGYFYL